MVARHATFALTNQNCFTGRNSAKECAKRHRLCSFFQVQILFLPTDWKCQTFCHCQKESEGSIHLSLNLIYSVFFSRHNWYKYRFIWNLPLRETFFSYYKNTIKLFVKEECVHFKNIWNLQPQEKKLQRKWCKPELKMIPLCLFFFCSVCVGEIRCGIKISFSRLFFVSFVSTGRSGSEGPSRCSIPWVNTASENFPCADSKASLACNRVTLL